LVLTNEVSFIFLWKEDFMFRHLEAEKFSIEEAYTIKNKFFLHLSLDYLFKQER